MRHDRVAKMGREIVYEVCIESFYAKQICTKLSFAQLVLEREDDYIHKDQKGNGYNGDCRIGKQKKKNNVLI